VNKEVKNISRKKLDIFIIGFALFSMFFGAGNVIFPPYLGLEAGSSWVVGFGCYYIADIGLALVALFALLKSGGTDGLMQNLGKTPATVLMTAIVLCIGPMLAIPRTGATTFELSMLPLIPEANSIVFSLLYFAIVLAFSIKESAVVDIIGKFLTPLLFIGLLALIIAGVINPLGDINTPYVDNIAAEGITSGYQTMDVLATLVFGYVVLKSVRDKGYTDEKQQAKIVAGGGVVSAIGLLVVYMGLTYLGSTVSTYYTPDINRSALVLGLVSRLMGIPGLLIFALVVGFACITTAVGLTSAAASYFERLLNGKISYKALTIIICTLSAILANFGLDKIISLAAPILSIVYPPTLVVIILSFLKHQPGKEVYRSAALGALLVSVLDTLQDLGVGQNLTSILPFDSIGFGWVIPSVLFGLIGLFIAKGKAVPVAIGVEGEKE
jgi:LIVCS family branched-chain amino acid:cation transporter